MHIRFILNMQRAVIEGQLFDLISISWTDHFSQNEVLAISHHWLATEHHLVNTMSGLERVESADLTIEPLD